MKGGKKERWEQRNKNIVLLFFIVLIVILLTAWFALESQASGKALISLSTLALIGGVLFEAKRISQKWSTVFTITLGSLVFSMLAFLPGKGKTEYTIAAHIELWPYFFIFIFALGSIIKHKERIIPRLTEGITLLQSIAVTYWVIDYGLVNTTSYSLKALLAIGLMFSLYSFIHAFTNITITRTGRLILSLWSSIVMLLFSVDNVYRVYQNEQIESATDLMHGAYIALQFFLLGICAIYSIQNFMMLFGFFPGRDTFFNAQYFRDVRKLKDDHITRYSGRQVSIGNCLFCAIFAGTIFAFNYYYQILPRHLAIWTVFVIFPLLLSVFQYRFGRYRLGYGD
ncbi:MAG TPA: hypothetical protein VD927_08585 [Chryseosolibacter sp.]|nr:hypothetical protein [Chryseosolibacter sp.]